LQEEANLPAWIWTFIVLAGGLFALKLSYVLCTALALPHTQGALYVSTSRRRIAAFLDAIPMTSQDRLVDLGCGDGRVLRQAVRRYGVTAIGYEVNWLAYLKARLLCIGIEPLRIYRRDFWEADLSAADVVFCYLYPDVLKRLAQKLNSELKPGALIVSANFTLPGFHPIQVLRLSHTLHKAPLFVYRSLGHVSPHTDQNEKGGLLPRKLTGIKS
jgi:SAM-dependent methyltransferase